MATIDTGKRLSLCFHNPEFEPYKDLCWAGETTDPENEYNSVQQAVWLESSTEVSDHLSDYVEDPTDEEEFHAAVEGEYDRAMLELAHENLYVFPHSNVGIRVTEYRG